MLNSIIILKRLLEESFDDACEEYACYDGDNADTKDMLKTNLDISSVKVDIFNEIIHMYDLPKSYEVCDCCGDAVKEEENKEERILTAVPDEMPKKDD